MKRGLVILLILILGVACTAEPVPEEPNLDEIWGNEVYMDNAIFRGYSGSDVSLELANSPQQFDRFQLTVEIEQLLNAAQFEEGKELLVQYKTSSDGQALLIDLKQEGDGEKLYIAAGTMQGLIGQEQDRIILSSPGTIEEFLLDEGIKAEFIAKVNVGQDIVVYYRQTGATKTIVDFE